MMLLCFWKNKYIKKSDDDNEREVKNKRTNPWTKLYCWCSSSSWMCFMKTFYSPENKKKKNETKTLCSYDKHTREKESHRPRLNWKCNVIPFPSMLWVCFVLCTFENISVWTEETVRIQPTIPPLPHPHFFTTHSNHFSFDFSFVFISLLFIVFFLLCCCVSTDAFFRGFEEVAANISL